MVFKEIIPVYTENHMKPINTKYRVTDCKSSDIYSSNWASPPKSNPWHPHCAGGKRLWTVNGALVYQSPGVRYCAEGCMALRW
jgi:hypothetical protein